MEQIDIHLEGIMGLKHHDIPTPPKNIFDAFDQPLYFMNGIPSTSYKEIELTSLQKTFST